MANVLGITIDTAEPRVKTDRVALAIAGSRNGVVQWDLLNSVNVYVDPVTHTAMLLPYPITPEWDTTATTGDPSSGFYRIGKAATNVASSSSWVEHIPNNVDGNVYLYGLGVNTVISPLGSFDQNRAWWFSYYSFGQGETFLQFQAIWGNVALDIFSDGTVQIYKNAIQVGAGNIGNLEPSDDSPTRKVGGSAKGGHRHQVTGAPISFMVIPCRTRELVFLCNRGGAFHAVFDDIPKDDPHPVILPYGTMTYQIPHGQAMVQAAPVRWLTSGYILSTTQTFRKAPTALQSGPSVSIQYDLPNTGVPPTISGSLKTTGGTSNFVADGSVKNCRFRVDMASDGSSSPFLYGASAAYDAITANTDGAHSVVLDDYTVEARLTVPEAPNGVQLSVTCKSPATVGASIPNYREIGNRPIVAKIGTIAFLTGRTKAPRLEYGPTDATSRIIWETRDRWKSYENYEILDPVPWDGRPLPDVIKEVAMYPGYPSSDMDVQNFDLTLPAQGQSSTGEWAVIAEAGDTCDKWLMKLYEDYARTAIVGWYPSATGPKFRFRTPESIGTTPSATIYNTRAAAIAAGYTEDNHWQHVVYDGYREDYLEPEANVLRVTGWDSRIDKAFQVVGEDSSAKDPTLVPSARPTNWTGEAYPVSVFDPAITDSGTAAYVFGVLRARLFKGQITAEIPCEMQFKTDGSPLWRGDVLRVDLVGNWRIRTMDVTPTLETATRVIRPARYTCEFIPGSL